MGDNWRHKRFRDDMKAAGFTVEEYRGRNYYDGPAVIVHVDQVQEVIRATQLTVVHDHMGKNHYVVYPAA